MAEKTAGKTASNSRVRGRPFKPGQSGNPAGRPAGTRNSHRLWEIVARAGDMSPVEFLLNVQNNPEQPTSLRLKAATALLPYVNRELPPYDPNRTPSADGPPPTDMDKVLASIFRSV